MGLEVSATFFAPTLRLSRGPTDRGTRGGRHSIIRVACQGTPGEAMFGIFLGLIAQFNARLSPLKGAILEWMFPVLPHPLTANVNKRAEIGLTTCS